MRHSQYRSRAALLSALLVVAASHPQPSTAPVPSIGPTAIVEPRDATRVAMAAANAAFPAGWRFQVGTPPTSAEHAMVVSNSRLASEAGIEILKAGGNAVDAAVATGFALAVTHPTAGNIGGGCFMNIRMADGRSMTLDYREMAPLAATRDMYLDANGKLTKKSTVGYL